MQKYFAGFLVCCLIFSCVANSSAFDFRTGTFGGKYSDVTFADFDYPSISGLPFHPNQDPSNISNNLWGVVALTSVHTLLDNDPELNKLGQPAYYFNGQDGKYYFAVYGGLALMPGSFFPGNVYLMDAGFNDSAYLKIYETTNPNLYNMAVAAGPNVAGAGEFGTFGLPIICGADQACNTADDPTLWLDAVYSPNTLRLYYDVFAPAGALEGFFSDNTVTGKTEGYLDAIGGTAAPYIRKGIFPIDLPLAPERADLKVISDLTADIGPDGWRSAWTTTSQDPITGEIIEPDCCIDIEKNVSINSIDFFDADICTDPDTPTALAPADAWYELVVTNCGNTYLTDTIITDTELGINTNIGTLAPGEVRTLTSQDIDALFQLERCSMAAQLENTAQVDATCSDGMGTEVGDSDDACIICEQEEASCRVTAGGNKDGIFCPLDKHGEPIVELCEVDPDFFEDITHTWGGQAGAPPRIDGNWTHKYLDSRDRPHNKFTFHSNDLHYIQCFDPGEFCQPARYAPNRQIDFSGVGRFTNTHGIFRNAPAYEGDKCFTVHLEDIGEPGPGGRWPNATEECDRCPGTTIEDADCTDCTDYYEIKVYDGGDPTTGDCAGGALIWKNGGSGPPFDDCVGGETFVTPFAPYEGYQTRAGNVQLHPDNNGP